MPYRAALRLSAVALLAVAAFAVPLSQPPLHTPLSPNTHLSLPNSHSLPFPQPLHFFPSAAPTHTSAFTDGLLHVAAALVAATHRARSLMLTVARGMTAVLFVPSLVLALVVALIFVLRRLMRRLNLRRFRMLRAAERPLKGSLDDGDHSLDGGASPRLPLLSQLSTTAAPPHQQRRRDICGVQCVHVQEGDKRTLPMAKERTVYGAVANDGGVQLSTARCSVIAAKRERHTLSGQCSSPLATSPCASSLLSSPPPSPGLKRTPTCTQTSTASAHASKSASPLPSRSPPRRKNAYPVLKTPDEPAACARVHHLDAQQQQRIRLVAGTAPRRRRREAAACAVCVEGSNGGGGGGGGRDDIGMLRCGHWFHAGCLRAALAHSGRQSGCPACL